MQLPAQSSYAARYDCGHIARLGLSSFSSSLFVDALAHVVAGCIFVSCKIVA